MDVTHRETGRVREPARLALLAAVCAASCLGACAEPPREVAAFTDLRARVPEQEVLEGHRLQSYVWNLGGDHRPVVGQHPPSRVALGPLPPGSDCRLRFGLGINAPAWPKSDGVGFRVSVGLGEGARVVFDEHLDPRALGEPRWLDREVALPQSEPDGPRPLLVLETAPGGSRDHDHAGWAAPHVECRRTRPDPPAPARPHVILVSIDTLRRDHLGLYGYWRDTSPRLDALARESLVFTEAFAPAPWTLPSHASMFTGLQPREHGAGHAATFVPLDGRHPTLAELLGDAGYRTIGFSAGGIMSRRFGLARGFERWTEQTKANLASVLPAVFAALGSELAEPTFLFLHTYDVHGPYAEWPGATRFEPSPRDPHASPAAWRRLLAIRYHRYLALERFSGLPELVAAYDSGIHHADRLLGRLFDRLREIGAFDHALVVVTSDHGETLHDRGVYVGHSYSLYDPEIRIPLLVRFPGAARVGRSDELVELVDVAPLVLEVAGVPVPAGLSGGNPLARIDGEVPPREWVEGESAHTGARYARSRAWKAVAEAHAVEAGTSRLPAGLRDRFDPSAQLYDLAADPAERANLLAAGDAPLGAAARVRSAAEGAPRPGTVSRPESEFGDDLLSELRQLGYVE